MRKLLFLTHRIPYPPNKGDKIRSFHLLEHLSKQYQIYLGTFIDSNEDWAYTEDVEKICQSTCFRPLPSLKSTLRSFTGFFTGEALTLPYYRDKALQRWVDAVLENEKINGVLVFSSAMAQYVTGNNCKFLYRVIDFVDIDSDKWRQYARKKSWPMNWVYNRESRYLAQYEMTIAASFDNSYFVSRAEADLFRTMISDSQGKIKYFNNGVNTDYFNSEGEYPNPFPAGKKVLVFTGAMDYWANIDAVVWFAKYVFASITKSLSDVHFYIVGSNPGDEVRGLASESITVTGSVPDIRPYLAYADLVVAPLRIARGIQNKVLEAMAMAKPVLVSRHAYEGIDEFNGFSGKICDEPEEMVQYCKQLFSGGSCAKKAELNRQFVIENYNWESNLKMLSQTLDQAVHQPC